MLKPDLTASPTYQIGPEIDAITIGASAGGLQALNAILPIFPAYFAIPIIIVLHVPQTKPSLLVELFTPKCDLTVREPDDKQAVTSGIWFAPPGYHLMIESGRTFALSVDDPVNFSRPSVDVLFQSAADVYGRKLLGVILSGANGDGALGAKSIAEKGGSILAQDPDEAEAEAMPLAAISAVKTITVAPLSRIANLLRDLTVRATP
jgi:two-component system, chemotaxis family, protein-glutamate methylesterase/glutaminase